MIFRVLDIETVADESCWTRGEPNYKLVPGPGGVPALRELDVVPPPQACRVVALSCVDVRFDAARDPRYFLDSCWTDCRWGPPGDLSSEATLLAAFAHAMEVAADCHLVTWNGRGFDLPVLAMRSLGRGIAAPWYYKNRDVRYRYSTEGHLDLMDFFADYGGSRCMKLGDVARLCGLPGKTDTSGGDVAKLYAEAIAFPEQDSKIRERVARYCLQDTLQTALVFLRSRHLVGKLTAETHDAALETFRRSPEVADALDLDWDRLKLARPLP